VHQVARVFREGGGVPYAEYRPEFTDVMDALGREVFDNFLVDAHVPLAAGLTDQLTAGARVADIACGTGHALVVLARAFPAPTFFACSTLHCMTVSLAHGGAGIGTVFGEGLARQMLADAGFGEVVVHAAPGDPLNAVYVSSKVTTAAAR